MVSKNTSPAVDIPGDLNENKIVEPQSFTHFQAYAKYLLENKAEDFANLQSALFKKINPPLLKYIDDVHAEEHNAATYNYASELLALCAENKTDNYIHNSVKEFFCSLLDFIPGENISIEDITLSGLVYRNTFKHFITAYTKDDALAEKILFEMDVFIAQAEAAGINLLLNQKSIPAEVKERPPAVRPNNNSKQAKSKEIQYQRMISEVEDYAIILMDKEGYILDWNKGAEKIKGYAASEIIGKNFRTFYRQEDRDKKLPDQLLEEALVTGRARHEGWRLRKDGSTFWGYIVITAIHDELGEVTGFLKVTRNLTERKLAEDTLKEYAARIEKHNEELQRINKELDSFTYMASHDLQEPLRKIRTFINIISSKSGDSFSPDIVNYFERIIASANRMQTLIDALLSYSRAGTAEMVFEPVKLNVLIDEVKKDLSEIIEEKKATVSFGELPVVEIHTMQFHQLFFNLIENAIKYSRENVLPEISIEATNFTANETTYCRITVKDNGIGFEQQYADNIFKLFHRLHGRSEYSGTGIGLAICKKVVENHKGTITAAGNPGEGAMFIIEMPVNALPKDKL